MHIIGIGTTFMTGLAVLARQTGHEVSGSDSCFDLPTRTKLTEAGVILKQGFSSSHLGDNPELVIIGNELSPTNEELLEVRRRGMPYISGSLWLEEYILHDKWKISAPANYESSETKKMLAKKPTVKRAPKPSPEPSTKINQRIVR
jgi:UDP-N-acetylmuramate: L-alanyl-gamma-D-glutamyl-meso-diaminopimelate ligase